MMHLLLQIGPSGITATVLIANLLTEEAGLIQQVLHGNAYTLILIFYVILHLCLLWKLCSGL